MPRTAQPRYFASRKGYYVQHRCKQYLLATGPKDEPEGPTYKAAVRRFSEIMLVGETDSAADDNPVIAIMDTYGVWLKRKTFGIEPRKGSLKSTGTCRSSN
jgi:hypothetical protein